MGEIENASAGGKKPLYLSLVKGKHQYLFTYPEGLEDALIEQFIRWAEEADLNFDWFDAAVLSRQINRRLLGEVPKS